MALRFLSGSTRTFLLAGLALNIIFSPVRGLTPSRALVAGFFTTFIFRSPGSVNSPPPRRLFLITPLSESKTLPTCLRDSPVSLEMLVRTSDFVGAPPFFAILRYSSRILVGYDAPRLLGARRESARKIAHARALARNFFLQLLRKCLFS